jgi:hypothetical protein
VCVCVCAFTFTPRHNREQTTKKNCCSLSVKQERNVLGKGIFVVAPLERLPESARPARLRSGRLLCQPRITKGHGYLHAEFQHFNSLSVNGTAAAAAAAAAHTHACACGVIDAGGSLAVVDYNLV